MITKDYLEDLIARAELAEEVLLPGHLHRRLLAEMRLLQDVAGAAEANLKSHGCMCDTHYAMELALKAWRGEPGTDANGSPV